MTGPQSVPLGGTNPPPFNALSSADALVTVGIGGNDAGLIGVVEQFVEIDAPVGEPLTQSRHLHTCPSAAMPTITA